MVNSPGSQLELLQGYSLRAGKAEVNGALQKPHPSFGPPNRINGISSHPICVASEVSLL